MPNIALVAHDAMKGEIVDWASHHQARLAHHKIYATGTTGGRLQEGAGLTVECLLSGPLGGDAQLGAMIAEKRLDALIFFIDPLSALPHDVDVKSLLRLAILYNTPLAVNRSTATALVHHLRNKE